VENSVEYNIKFWNWVWKLRKTIKKSVMIIISQSGFEMGTLTISSRTVKGYLSIERLYHFVNSNAGGGRL
jgi:hypothetical protein